MSDSPTTSAAQRAPRYMPFCRLSEPHAEVDHKPNFTDCLCPCHGTPFAWWTPKEQDHHD